MDDLSSLKTALNEKAPGFNTLSSGANAVSLNGGQEDAGRRRRLQRGQSSGPASEERLAELDKIDGICREPSEQDKERPTVTPVATFDGRTRAQEVGAASKIVPKIMAVPADFLGVVVELRNWFETAPTRADAEAVLKDRDILFQSTATAQEPSDISSASDLLKKIHSSPQSIDWEFIGDDWSESFSGMSRLFIALVVNDDTIPPDFIVALIRRVASLRWQSDEPLLGPLLQVLRLALLRAFGGSDALREARHSSWVAAREAGQTELDKDTVETHVSPEEYELFWESVVSRFPVYTSPDPEDLPSADSSSSAASPAIPSSILTSPQTRSNQLHPQASASPQPSFRGQQQQHQQPIPFVPASIREACNLYSQRVRISPEMMQLWREQQLLQDGSSSYPELTHISRSLDAVARVYRLSVSSLKSFARVVVEFIMAETSGIPNANVHAAVTVLHSMLDWFRASHILSFEYFAALLFDAQYHLVSHRYLLAHPAVRDLVLAADREPGWWSAVRPRSMSIAEWGADRLFSAEPNDSVQTDPAGGFVATQYNPLILELYTRLVGVSRQIVQGHPQRIMIVAELSVDSLKPLLSVYNTSLWAEVLGLIKLEVPYNGKRWRYLNMELISAIWMHCASGRLDDDWLTGSDISVELKDAPAKEAAIRRLVEFYNKRLN